MRTRTLAIALAVILSSISSHAGGPAFVAGSGYDPGVEGRPIVWANASLQYFTDQGDLSPILTNGQADSLVASAISAWTGAPGVGLATTQAGHLAEDVNGSNIQATMNGTITAPADITSSAIQTPVGVVYDYDGSVTDALLGEGAGSLADCFTNAVYGGPDNFSSSGNFAHAVIVINGVCASTNSQLPDVQYRLVRTFGRVLGLGWSQANGNVQTHNPAPTSADLAGFPVMHFKDLISCVPITLCYPDAATPKMDDVTALARLYPSPNGNPLASGRVWGGVYFTDASGFATQQMQGVNVVARLMQGGQPSRQYVVTSVSGFQFVGNAGNIITGYKDADGLRFDRFGSSDSLLEGFFDLGQLTIPSGQTIAQYQLSVEPLDAKWSMGVEPYAPYQVAPSGAFAPVVVTVVDGSDAERDILFLGSAIAQTHPGSGSTYTNPAQLPQGGEWGSWISGYGATDWFEFKAQANRTASISVTALDEAGKPTESKLLPIIGVWQLSDQTENPAPAATPIAFNSMTFGMSRLDAVFSSSDTYRLGITDYRGDGRPDYAYQASLLYSDTASPPRAPMTGGVTTLQGIGFRPGLQVSAGGKVGSVLSQSATELQIAFPAASQDGPVTIQITDPDTGGFSQMLAAFIYGAGPTDRLLLLQGTEPATPIDAQAANLIRVRAVASDGVTPVNGATIAWSSTNGIGFSACLGATSCSVLSDADGEASTWVTPTLVGPGTIIAALAPASYSPPQTQRTTLVGTSSTLDLAAVTPTHWIAQGASMDVPLTVEVLALGVPKPNVAINFILTQGNASLSAGSAPADGAGYATITVHLINHNSTVQVSACVAPGNNPCQTFTLFATPPSMWTLEPVSGTSQVVPTDQPFQSLVMRVTDGTAVDNPVWGVNVTFLTTLERIAQGVGGVPPEGDAQQNGSGMPVILGTSQTQLVSGPDGVASITPSVGNLGPCEVLITVTAGGAVAQLALESVPALAVDQPSKKNEVSRARPRTLRFAANQPGRPDAVFEIFAVPETIPPSVPSWEDSTTEGLPPVDSGAEKSCPKAMPHKAQCQVKAQ